MKTRVRVSWEELSKRGLAPSWWKETYPKYFQLEAEVIEEKSDEDLLAEWICCGYDESAIRKSKNVALCLLSSKAINPEFLEKLRKGEK